jgi:hypothetical protein
MVYTAYPRSAAQVAAFESYVKQEKRSFKAISDEYNVSLSVVKRWAKNDHWARRANEVDASVAKGTMKLMAIRLTEKNMRHIQIAKDIQEDALNEMKDLKYRNKKDALIAVKIAADIENAVTEELKQKPPQQIDVTHTVTFTQLQDAYNSLYGNKRINVTTGKTDKPAVGDGTDTKPSE